MGIHLLIVGQHHHYDRNIDPVYGMTKSSQTETFKVEQCSSPSALVKTVRGVARTNSRMIDALDLYDHGASGHLYMGDEKLFVQDGTGRLIARALRPLLTPDARVRLLGCETAVGDDGRALLLMLREELGRAVIYGTLRNVYPKHFDHGGFRVRWDDTFLFSSTEAAMRPVPTHSDREAELASWAAANLT
jgi:hypothetical protein